MFFFDFLAIFEYLFIVLRGDGIMIAKKPILLSVSMFTLLLALISGTAIATTYTVVPDVAQCPADPVNNPCSLNLQDALTAADAGDSVEVRPGTYTGNFSLSRSVSLYGNETATTVLSGSGSGAILTIDNATSGMTIRRLTFSNAATGILVRNSTSVQIANNIFQLGAGGAAVQTANSPTTNITNNTFYQGLQGIYSDTTTLTINNNIFSGTSVAISPSTMDLASLQYNLFFGGAIGPPIVTDASSPDWKRNLADQDPLFLNPDISDFHLKAGSPCIDKGYPSIGTDSVDGTTADMGAYGGPTADTIPRTVTNVSTLPTSTASTSITVSWDQNPSYVVKGYRIYYGTASGKYQGTGASEGASPVTVLSSASTTTTLNGLPSSSVALGSPATVQTQPLDQSLAVSWSPVADATGYRVYYSDSSFNSSSLPSTYREVGATASVTLTGLTNGQTYHIAVSAVAQAVYYIAVTAFDSLGESGLPPVAPGASHESAFSQEVSVPVGLSQEGVISTVISDFPEALVPYPALPNTRKGCFIATAAYGYYSAPALQALRNFRDRYLMTTAAGRTFVAWYYRHGPAAAAFLNTHPEYKPAVRAALMPAVGAAIFMTRTSLTFKTILFLVLGLIVAYGSLKKRSCSGSSAED